ncbi:hypothetical protein [Aureispira anguillae]|uniref:YD repeat-containing protein n=1 Tax=Aureispira anguillae TaxID=2864201 RepID=A0A916DSD4_9BACT|nr:hypothetical protein [Aureispira anguillae]BDS10736.1 hypothetical protein AsAng_0014450 [Aureispira anguillae]
MRIIVLFFCLLPFANTAQNGYSQWLSVQGTEMHLLGDFKEKRVYGNPKGEQKKVALMQVQRYENGRLKRDVMYNGYPQLMYDMVIDYQEDGTARGINVLDSSIVTYAFTNDKKIRYYVVDQQSATHVIYTYNDKGALIRCKDCLAPFGNHEWCAYYQYIYNEQEQLIKVLSYNLEKGMPVESKVLFATDSLEYEQGLLKNRWTLNPAGNVTQKAVYKYNKKNLLEQEESTQLIANPNPKRYTKNYTYHCNKRLKQKVEAYYTGSHLDGQQIAKYNPKGWKIRQESYRGDGKRTKYYKIKYKG